MTSSNLSREMHLLSLFIEEVLDQRYGEYSRLICQSASKQIQLRFLSFIVWK